MLNFDSILINDCLLFLKLEPIFKINSSLIGYEVLSDIKTVGFSSEHICPEVFFKSLTHIQELLIFKHQLEFANKYRSYFIQNKLFITINAGEGVINNFPWHELESFVRNFKVFLKIEINETYSPSKFAFEKLKKISHVIPLWLDDFGLSEFNIYHVFMAAFEGVKIDKKIYWQLRGTKEGIDFLSALCDHLYKNGVCVIIEGVETENDVHMLGLFGSTVSGQGWLWPSIKVVERLA